MPDDLKPADPDHIRLAIGYALRFGSNGKRHRVASDDMAHLAAEIIASHLERAGFVVMVKPAPSQEKGPLPSTIPLKP